MSDENQQLMEKQSSILVEQQETIKQLISANTATTVSLEEVAFKWSKLDSDDGYSNASFDKAIKELDRLSKNVDAYSVN